MGLVFETAAVTIDDKKPLAYCGLWFSPDSRI